MLRNVPLFIAFRLLFNSRFYYPVLGVLFLDLGLSLEQYALLNVAWAGAIVALEVPLGSLADRWGRRRMVVLAAALMVLEMAALAFAPAGGGSLLFAVLLANRLLSGAAEACASGADEALAYDSLAHAGQSARWPRVLERLMRLQSVAFFATMLAGAAAYDAAFWKSVASVLGPQFAFAPAQSLRFPLYLTLAMSVGALAAALLMREPPSTPRENHTTWQGTLAAGRWLLASGFALAVILAGLCFDAFVRIFLTYQSNFLRGIGLPEASFGLVGAGFALLGLAAAPLGRRMVERRNAGANFAAVAALALAGLTGAALARGPAGLAALLPLGLVWSLLQLFISTYLNRATPSAIRATVLSFKGLAINLAYGLGGFLFAAIIGAARRRAPEGAGETEIFSAALTALPILLALAVAALFPVFRRLRRDGAPPPAEPAAT
jgi:MFS family permease